MSKNIMVSIVLVAVALLSTNRVVWGQNPGPQDGYPLSYVFGLVDVLSPTVVRSVGELRSSFYDPNLSYGPNNPWPASHLTRNNNRIPHHTGIELFHPEFLHIALSGNSILNFRLDTAEAANKLWDTIYSTWGYTKVNPNASIDISMNCHGYSTGKNTWMSLQPALSDDYNPSNNFNDLAPGVIFANPNTVNITVLNSVLQVGGHSARIENVRPPTINQNGDKNFSITVYEKNRVSAVYKKEITIVWERDDSDPSNVVFKMVTPRLSWGTFSHFHVKQ